MTTTNKALSQWVADVAALTQPQEIVWCDGSDQEYQKLIEEMTEAGTLSSLNPETHPCLLYTSPSPRDRQKSRMPSSA